MADYFPKYRIGRWLRANPRQAGGYAFICPDCEKTSYFIGKGEKKIGRYCTWCGADNNKDGEVDE